jgi:hypothetical protein
MGWRDEVADESAVKLSVIRPAEANKPFAEFVIGGLLLLIALGGLAM